MYNEEFGLYSLYKTRTHPTKPEVITEVVRASSDGCEALAWLRGYK